MRVCVGDDSGGHSLRVNKPTLGMMKRKQNKHRLLTHLSHCTLNLPWYVIRTVHQVLGDQNVEDGNYGQGNRVKD